MTHADVFTFRFVNGLRTPYGSFACPVCGETALLSVSVDTRPPGWPVTAQCPWDHTWTDERLQAVFAGAVRGAIGETPELFEEARRMAETNGGWLSVDVPDRTA